MAIRYSGPRVQPVSMSSNNVSKRLYMLSADKLPWAPQSYMGTPLEWLNATDFLTGTGAFMLLEGAKYVNPSIPGFFDYFSWVPYARYVSAFSWLNGTQVDMWTYTAGQSGAAFTMLTASGTSTPLYLEVNSTSPVYGNTSTRYRFQTFTPDRELPHVWDGFDEASFRHPTPCALPDSGAQPHAVNQTVFIFHPKPSASLPARDAFNITMQDNGDLRGDVFFVCQDLLTNASRAMGEDYQWITRWEIELVPRWGQYQNCNGYPNPSCLGAEDFWVGHEAAIGMGTPDGGQCVSNALTGEWFSLPLGGQCHGESMPDGRTCTWRPRRVKTIDAQCLFGHGYLARCRDGTQRAPFTTAEKLFEAAFASDDPAAHGCPALPGP